MKLETAKLCVSLSRLDVRVIGKLLSMKNRKNTVSSVKWLFKDKECFWVVRKSFPIWLVYSEILIAKSF